MAEQKPEIKEQATQPPLGNLARKVTNSSFIKEFKEFINRGSVVDLAIGVAVGGAFTAIVKSLVDDIVMPITSLLGGGADFSSLAIDVPNIFGADTVAHIAYGNFIQNVVNFLIIAFVVFVIVKFLNRMNADMVKADKIKADSDERAAQKEATEKKHTA